MKRSVNIVLIALIILSLLTSSSCAKKNQEIIVTPVPEYQQEVTPKNYYDNWVECEAELKKLVIMCDQL